MSKPKNYDEMLGEFFREAGVLVGVFGVLDVFVQKGGDTDFVPIALVVCFVFVVIGMIIERTRQAKA